MWSGHVHRVYSARRTSAAENQRHARQKSGAQQAELDSGVGAAVSAANFVMIKGRPPRLGQILQTYAPPVLPHDLAIHRQKIGDLKAAHPAFEAYVSAALVTNLVWPSEDIWTMRDHMHLFVRGGDDFKLAQSIAHKSCAPDTAASTQESSLATDLCWARMVSVAGLPNALG